MLFFAAKLAFLKGDKERENYPGKLGPGNDGSYCHKYNNHQTTDCVTGLYSKIVLATYALFYCINSKFKICNCTG